MAKSLFTMGLYGDNGKGTTILYRGCIGSIGYILGLYVGFYKTFLNC